MLPGKMKTHLKSRSYNYFPINFMCVSKQMRETEKEREREGGRKRERDTERKAEGRNR